MDQTRYNEAVRAAWTMGRLTYKLKPIQRRLQTTWEEISKFSRQILTHIGRQTGKSFFWNTVIIEQCIRNPNTICVYVAPVEKKLSSFVRGIHQAIFADCPKDLAPERLSNTNQIRFKNGSVIHYFGSNNDAHNAIRGLGSVTLVILDEAGFFRNLPELIAVVGPMLLRTKGRLVYSSSSPETPDHPLVAIIEQAKLEGWYVLHPTWDDETLDPEALAQLYKLLGGKDSTKSRREIGCEIIVEKSRAVLPQWDNKYVKELVKPNTYRFFNHIVSFDPGFKDPSSVTFATYLYGHAIMYVEDEIVVKGKDVTIGALCALIQAKVLELWPGSERVTYWADPANQTLLDEMGKKYKLYFNWTAKDKKKQGLEGLNQFIADGQLILSPKAAIHATMFNNTIWNHSRSDFERSASGYHGDCIDSTLYAYRNLDLSNPVPSLYTINLEDVMIKNPQAYQDQQAVKKWISGDMDDHQQFNNDASYNQED